MQYEKQLSFLNEKIKPYILSEGVGDGYFTTSINNDTVIFEFYFLMDYLPFRRFLYKNDRFYNLNNIEYVKMNEDFIEYEND